MRKFKDGERIVLGIDYGCDDDPKYGVICGCNGVYYSIDFSGETKTMLSRVEYIESRYFSVKELRDEKLKEILDVG